MPAPWHIGAMARKRSSGPKQPYSDAMANMLKILERCGTSTPFGLPVVPDVYGIVKSPHSSTCGGSFSGRAFASQSSKSFSITIVFSTDGISTPASASALAASTNNTRAFASPTIAAISAGASFGLTVASATPACDAPTTISMYSIEFAATMAP